MEKINLWLKRTRPAWVWMLRVALGAVFIASGMAKSIDVWGTVYKMEEYLLLWDLTQPRTLVLMGAMVLCGAEFVLGALLLLGAYRRVAVWLMTALMAFMLPLSLWIWIENPVADCGCFGDMWVLSNRATFWKNVAITAGLLCLWRPNRRVAGIVSPYSQWLAGAALTLYIAAIALVGYNIQPLVDFRRFPQGSRLVADAAADDTETEYAFIYENAEGKRERFSADNLPDSTWTFVDRELLSGSESVSDAFTILDEGEDITGDVIADEGEQLLVVIPEMMRVNPSHTYAINTLNRYITGRGGVLTALLAPDRHGIDYWNDISMADYPVYNAEPTLLKELVRGNVGLVYLVDGKIVWKRSLASVDTAVFDSPEAAHRLATMTPPGSRALGQLTVALLIALGIIVTIDRTGVAINWLWRRKNKKKSPTDSKA